MRDLKLEDSAHLSAVACFTAGCAINRAPMHVLTRGRALRMSGEERESIFESVLLRAAARCLPASGGNNFTVQVYSRLAGCGTWLAVRTSCLMAGQLLLLAGAGTGATELAPTISERIGSGVGALLQAVYCL